MLPFGLTTDVSAGALAAGSGGALGAGAAGSVSGDAAPGATVFADELKATAETGAVATPEGGAASRPGDAKVVLPASASKEAIDVLKKAANDPAAAQPPVPAAQPEPLPGAAGADMADVSTDAEVVVSDPAGPEDAQIDEGAVLAALAEPLPVAPAPLPGATPAGQADGASVLPAAVPSGAVPPAAGVSGNGIPGGMLPGAPGGQQPQPPAVANPNAANGLQRAANAGTNVSGEAASPQAGMHAAASPGRRWQNELPLEFRATQPQPLSQAQAGQSRAASPLTASISAAAGAAQTAAPSVLSGNGAAGSTVPTAGVLSGADPAQAPQTTTGPAGGAQTATLQVNSGQPMSGGAAKPAGGQPLVDQPSAQLPSELTTAAGQVASRPSGASTAATGPMSAGVTSPSAPVQPSVQSTQAPLTVQVDDALPGEPAVDDGATLTKPGPGTGTTAATAKTAGVATTQAAPGADTPAANTQVAAAPVAAVAAQAAVVMDDADLPATDPATVTGSDFTAASVRGGDLHGAMRTESLQTPNQTQSAHVATQVAAEIARNLKDGNTRFQMRFDPPELGRVEVNMRVGADGSVQAHLIVDRPETLDMFLRDQRGLERALEAAGLNPDSDNLQFSLKQDGGQEFASNEGDGGQQSGGGDSGSEAVSEMEPDVIERVRLMLAEQRGGLDMKV